MNQARLPERDYHVLIWIGFFLYASAVSLAVQFVILPHIFPDLHWGHGLLVGLDCPTFHKETVSLVEKIRVGGWSEWKLRPNDQGIVGVAAFFYYYIWPEPWSLIPLNAAIHASTVALLYSVMTSATGRKKESFYAAIIVGMYPSAMTWYTQMHKDGFSCLGLIMVLLAWVEISRVAAGRAKPIQLLASAAYCLAGTVLIWIMRPYLMDMVIALSLTLLAAITVIAAVFYKKGEITASIFAMTLLVSVICITFAFKLPKYSYILQLETKSFSGSQESFIWTKSVYLPEKVDGWFERLVLMRGGFYQEHPEAGSNIDADVRLSSAWDVMVYLPRGLQIALLSPFPWDWFAEGTTKATTYMRRISGLEMTIVYLSMISIIFNATALARRPVFWIIAIFSLGYLVVLGLGVPNVGTLYRMRFAPLAILIALGLTLAFSWALGLRGVRGGVRHANAN